MAIYIFAGLACLYVTRRVFFSNIQLATFFSACWQALVINGVITAAAFAVYVFYLENPWNDVTKKEFARRMQCEVVVAETVQGQAQTVCLAAMLVWGSPGIVVMFSFVFAAVMRILSMQRRGTDQQGMYLRMFLSCVILLVVGLWVAANVSGAGVRMSNT